jgi:hypothetical protein
MKTERENEQHKLEDVDDERSGLQANTPFRLNRRVVLRAGKAELKDSG